MHISNQRFPAQDFVASLMEACNKENVEIAAALLRAGADPNVVCNVS